MYAKAEFVQIKKQHELDSKFESSWLSMLTYAPYRKRLIFGSLWVFFVESSGVMVIVSMYMPRSFYPQEYGVVNIIYLGYGPTIYGLLGYGPEKQLIYTAAWLTLTLGCNVISAFTIDLMPRNKYAATGLTGCVACLVLEAALIAHYLKEVPPNTAALQAAVFATFLFAAIYGIFMDCSMFAFLGEIYPNHIRSKGVNLGLTCFALVNILWTTPAPYAFK